MIDNKKIDSTSTISDQTEDKRKKKITPIILFAVGAIGLIYVRGFMPDEFHNFRSGGTTVSIALLATASWLWTQK